MVKFQELALQLTVYKVLKTSTKQPHFIYNKRTWSRALDNFRNYDYLWKYLHFLQGLQYVTENVADKQIVSVSDVLGTNKSKTAVFCLRQK